MNQTLEYGPYTPQEVERISEWLKNNQVEFTLSKDDETEKLAMMNDGQNIVSKAEFRTSVYLGQVFYVQVAKMSELQKQNFEKLFSATDEVFKNQTNLPESEDQQMVKTGAKSQSLKKRTWAMILFLLLVAPIVVSFFLK